jgi:hypothetical protein
MHQFVLVSQPACYFLTPQSDNERGRDPDGAPSLEAKARLQMKAACKAGDTATVQQLLAGGASANDLVVSCRRGCRVFMSRNPVAYLPSHHPSPRTPLHTHTHPLPSLHAMGPPGSRQDPPVPGREGGPCVHRDYAAAQWGGSKHRQGE